ncbi:MAG: hypothetical protein ACRD22_10645 [Terriglobia bacterium]
MYLRRQLAAVGLMGACAILSATPVFASTSVAPGARQFSSEASLRTKGVPAVPAPSGRCGDVALTADRAAVPNLPPGTAGTGHAQSGEITSYNQAHFGPLPSSSQTTVSPDDTVDVDFECAFGATAVLIYSVSNPGPVFFTIYGITITGAPVVSHGFKYCGGGSSCIDTVQESIPSPNAMVSFVEINAIGNRVTVNGHFCF